MTPAWAGVRRLLAVRLDAMGDVLMTTPALRALRRSLPGVHVTLLTSPAGARVAALVPEVDAVIAHDAAWVRTAAPPPPEADLALVERLRAGRYDAAVIFTVYSQSALPAALLLRLAGIPLRAAHVRENPYALLTDRVPETEPQQQVRHEVQRQLDLVAAVGCTVDDASEATRLGVRVPPAARMAIRERLAAAGIAPGRPYLVVHPGASAPSRRYPPEPMGRAAGLVARRLALPLVIAGGPDDRAAVDAVQACAGSGVVLGDLPDVAALAALLAGARLLIGNNSGPAHLAAAVGTPVVDLYALTNPQHAPWGVPHRVLSHDVDCRWCYASRCTSGHHGCLRGITVEAIVSAAVALHAETAPSRGPAVADCTRSNAA